VHANLFQKWDGFDLLYAKRLGAKTVGHVRSLGTQVDHSSMDISSCDVIVCVSDAVLDSVVAAHPFAPVRRVYNPIESNGFAARIGQGPAKQMLGLWQEPVIVSVGALDPRKGHDCAIRTLALLRSYGCTIALAIAGAPYDARDNNELARLKAIAEDCGVSDDVHFLGKIDDMSRVYAAANIVLALSHDGEAFGRVPVEAAFASRPVIATAKGATPEIVKDGQTGLLVGANDAEGVASAVRRLLEDDAMRRRIVNAAYERATSQYGQIMHVEAVLQVYRELLPNSGIPD
jgi:glycosyltransferase involved in cell wall biosynthesis